ncbi:hypothetical protein [Streptomyces chartreusis]
MPGIDNRTTTRPPAGHPVVDSPTSTRSELLSPRNLAKLSETDTTHQLIGNVGRLTHHQPLIATDSRTTPADTAPHAPDPRLAQHEGDAEDALDALPGDWQQRRKGVPVARIDTQHFEPAADVPVAANGRIPGIDGRIPGTMTHIRHDVRRIELPTGDWVREITLRLDLHEGEGVSPKQAHTVAERAAGVVEQHVNQRYRFANGDQFHLRLEFGSLDPHALVTIHPGNHSTQNHWSATAPDGELAHEILHHLGLRDTYPDPQLLLHRGITPGLMGHGHDTTPIHLTEAHLARIDHIHTTTNPLHNHSLPGTANNPADTGHYNASPSAPTTEIRERHARNQQARSEPLEHDASEQNPLLPGGYSEASAPLRHYVSLSEVPEGLVTVRQVATEMAVVEASLGTRAGGNLQAQGTVGRYKQRLYDRDELEAQAQELKANVERKENSRRETKRWREWGAPGDGGSLGPWQSPWAPPRSAGTVGGNAQAGSTTTRPVGDPVPQLVRSEQWEGRRRDAAAPRTDTGHFAPAADSSAHPAPAARTQPPVPTTNEGNPPAHSPEPAPTPPADANDPTALDHPTNGVVPVVGTTPEPTGATGGPLTITGQQIEHILNPRHTSAAEFRDPAPGTLHGPADTTETPRGPLDSAIARALDPQRPTELADHATRNNSPTLHGAFGEQPGTSNASPPTGTTAPARTTPLFTDAFPNTNATPKRQADFDLLANTAAQRLNRTPTVDDLQTFATEVLTAHGDGTTRPSLDTVMDTLAALSPDHRAIYLNTAGQPPITEINKALGKLTEAQHNTLTTQASALTRVPIVMDTDATSTHQLNRNTVRRIAHALLPRDGLVPDQVRTQAGSLAKRLGVLRDSGATGAGPGNHAYGEYWRQQDSYGGQFGQRPGTSYGTRHQSHSNRYSYQSPTYSYNPEPQHYTPSGSYNPWASDRPSSSRPAWSMSTHENPYTRTDRDVERQYAAVHNTNRWIRESELRNPPGALYHAEWQTRGQGWRERARSRWNAEVQDFDNRLTEMVLGTPAERADRHDRARARADRWATAITQAGQDWNRPQTGHFGYTRKRDKFMRFFGR